jgi:pimeloyl-ACP methyl ester carboxylesterase
MQALLEQGQRVVRIGEDIGFAGEVIGLLGEAGQHVLEEQLESLLRERQAGRQGHNLVLHLWVEGAERPPGGLGNRAAAGWRWPCHLDHHANARMIATAADGTHLNYVVAGSGPPLVLVGGRTSSIDGAWWRYLPALARGLKVIAFDNRGAGASDKPDTPYTTALMAEDALTVLRKAGETSAHWFGLSMGGMILQQLALAHPDAVRSLILGATHCGGDRPPATGADQLTVEGPLRRYANLYDARFIADHPDWVQEDAKHFGKMPLHAIVRQDQAVKRHNLCDRLGEIRQPVLILHGRQDRMVPLARGEELERGLPQARLHVLDPAGHQMHSEQFATVLRLVQGFVAEVERQRG